MKKYCFLVSSVFLFSSLLADENASKTHLEHRISNLETENSYLKQKIVNQETTLDSLRDEMSALIRATKELTEKSSSSSETKIAQIEKNVEKLIADMKQFKNHSNDTADALTGHQKSLKEFEETFTLQKKQLKEFEEALKSLAKAMSTGIPSKPEECVATKGKNTYRVRSGDSLGKIAINFKKSVTTLREANQLRSDVIVPGQELVIPE